MNPPSVIIDQHIAVLGKTGLLNRLATADKMSGPERGLSPAPALTTPRYMERSMATAQGILAHAAPKVNETTSKPCEFCGKEFPVTKRHPGKRFCSVSCSKRFLPTPAPKNCIQCGKQFQPTRKYPQQRFCSRGCGFKATLPEGHNARVAKESAAKRGKKQRGRGSGKGYVKLNGRHAHRVIAEQQLGRPLAPGEVVHHDNENKQDNTPSNLVTLPSQADHARLHFTGTTQSPEQIAKRVASRKATIAARKAGAR